MRHKNQPEGTCCLVVPVGADLPENNPTYYTQLSQLQVHALANGATDIITGNEVCYCIFYERATLDAANVTLLSGGRLDDFKFFFKVSDLDAQVPAGVPNSDYLDENDTPVLHTWRTWCRSDIPPLTDGTDFYIRSSANTGKDVAYDAALMGISQAGTGAVTLEDLGTGLDKVRAYQSTLNPEA